MYWPSFQSLKTSELWKKLDKKMKWTYMGMWTVEDSQMHSDNPEYILEPNMAYLNKRKAGFKPRPSRQDEESEN
jgi:hypothetical protein